mmetsp:Transcript_2913/g.5225  ORF Transcript_2913/g.5225 Transcript_2913/m.5225 type:complete len:81 (+) Transcript_2913:12-254(+)
MLEMRPGHHPETEPLSRTKVEKLYLAWLKGAIHKKRHTSALKQFGKTSSSCMHSWNHCASSEGHPLIDYEVLPLNGYEVL